jgi:hypothetical protein
MGNLASVLDELLAPDPRDLPAVALLSEISESRRQVNRADGLYMRQLVVADRSGATQATHGSTQSWLSAALNVDPRRAHRDVGLARDLADALPLVLAALCDGSISLEHAQVIAGVRGRVPDEALRKAEPILVDAATWKTPRELGKVCAHLVHSCSPDKATRDEKDDYAARSLHASVTIGRMGVGNFVLHPAGMELLLAALNACSTHEDGDTRTPQQRRADALLTMAELALRGGTLPDSGGVKPQVSVVVNLDTLTGTTGAPGADYGYGATSSGEWARRYSCDASIARIVFGPDGEILDSGRATRTFTTAQRRAIIARDRCCIWPGCDAPPAWCDCHHCVHWGHDGVTSVENGALLCGRHHDRVHANGHAIIKTTTGPYKINPQHGSDPNWQGHHHRPRRT